MRKALFGVTLFFILALNPPLIILFTAENVNTANIDKGIPSKIILILYGYFKAAHFDAAETHTTGSMLKWINDIKRFMLEAPPKKIEAFKAKYRSLERIRIYGEYISGKYAFVYSLWIYKAPQDAAFFYKIHDNIHLLEKINGKWLIRSVRFNGEYTLYNKQKVQEIEREAIRQERLRNERRNRSNR